MCEDILFFQDDYRWLSNFTPCEVYLDGVKYPSVENAYQAAKTLGDRTIFQICSASRSKRLGKTIDLRKDWNKIKLNVMFDLCFQKYNQEPFTTLLLQTGNCKIVEGNTWGDTYWGVCDGIGSNHLGMIIMQIRNLI